MSDKIHEQLQELFLAYAKKLPSKIDEIEQLWQELCENWHIDKLREFHRATHTLSGSCGTYGYTSLSQLLHQIEKLLHAMLSNANVAVTDQVEVALLVGQLQSITIEVVTPQEFVSPTISHAAIQKNKLIFILEQNGEYTHDLKINLDQLGYIAKVFTDSAELINAIMHASPIALVINVNQINDESGAFLKNWQTERQTIVPIFCISNDGDLATRLKAIRMGGCEFFQKPIEPFYLTKEINELCSIRTNEPLRVLIVDDSQPLAEYYALVLQSEGINAKAISDPLACLDVMMEFEPNILLLDVYMPSCSGLELAAVLRQEACYASIPIIFLSTEDDRFKQLSALSLGGDDFLMKPIMPHYLVASVKSRAKRAEVLRSYITRDSLTGLLNHTNILQQLEMELLHAQRHHEIFSYVMVDIDYFKRVNDNYGHPMGDYVLHKISELFVKRLRKVDSIGRYGGEEFAIILPGADPATAEKICEELRAMVAETEFKSGNTVFRVTISAGIASYPALQDLNSLIAAADHALYQAKRSGRNKIMFG